MHFELVQNESATRDVRRIFEAVERTQGAVANFSRVLAHRPAVLRAYNQLYGAVWADSALPRQVKELAFLRVAVLNGCEY
jgi:alkylhydroperoxidase family enzyme